MMLRRLVSNSASLAAAAVRLQEKTAFTALNGQGGITTSFKQLMRYSSDASNSDPFANRVNADSATHEDFQPTVKTSHITLEDIVRQDVKDNPIMIYMKGLPDAPRCGFSALAIKVLQQYGVPIGARDILSDMRLKESVKAFSNWPTFPQIFIKGEFVGGSDIILSMHQKGELKDLLSEDKKDGA
ncbi:hypothetical protein LUZ60_002098 [Juncus effusus]|nr:hypothetical protein LUZ60_002098 [Juncus effusus]